MDINPLSDVSVNRFSHLWVVFLFCWCFPLLCKNLLDLCSPICLFFFFCFPWMRWYISHKLLPWAMSEIILPMIYSIIFMVLGLIFKCVIHFEFILLCGIRKRSSFIFLQISIQFSQDHSLNTLSLEYCMCLLALLNINWV